MHCWTSAAVIRKHLEVIQDYFTSQSDSEGELDDEDSDINNDLDDPDEGQAMLNNPGDPDEGQAML